MTLRVKIKQYTELQVIKGATLQIMKHPMKEHKHLCNNSVFIYFRIVINEGNQFGFCWVGFGD